VVVHYSIYNAEGKELKGDAVTVTFSSSQTDVDDIIGKNFPIICFVPDAVDLHQRQSPQKKK